MHALLDINAAVCSYQENAIPLEKWKPIKYTIKIIGINVHKTTIQNKAENLKVWLKKENLLKQTLMLNRDIVLGNNLIIEYLSMIVEK